MKCEIVRDLLPLYDEKLCRAESAALVEEHLKTCAACRSLLEKFPEAEHPKTDENAIKPFVKVKRRLRTRSVILIVLGVLLLAVLIPVGYLTVNQIFHINGGTDFEDLIYKHEARQFAEMLAEGRMEEYVQHLKNVYLGDAPDGISITDRSFYLEKLKAAYENVKKYDPRVGKIYSHYHKFNDGYFMREQYFMLEFTRADGSVFETRIDRSVYGNSNEYGIPMQIPVEISKLYGSDPEKTNYENYSDMEEYSPADLREICAYINTLYLADGGDLYIPIIESYSQKRTAAPHPEEWVDRIGHLIAINFTPFDYKAVYDGFADYVRSNCLLYTSVGNAELDTERNVFYYPVTLSGFDGENEAAIVSIKLYYDEFGLHSPRPEDIEYITGTSDLGAKLAGIFG